MKPIKAVVKFIAQGILGAAIDAAPPQIAIALTVIEGAKK